MTIVMNKDLVKSLLDLDDNVSSSEIHEEGVVFWMKGDPDDMDDEKNSLSVVTTQAIGNLEVMFNDCEGYYNEGMVTI